MQPDIVFVAQASSSKLVPEGLNGAPDLAIEILCPSTSRRDIPDKRRLFTKFGVLEYWIVVPETRQIQIYRLQEEPSRPVRILEEIDTFESELLPGLSIPVVFED